MSVSCEPDEEEPSEVNRLTGIKLAAATAPTEGSQDLRRLVLLKGVLARTGKAVSLQLKAPLTTPTPLKDKKKKSKRKGEEGLATASLLHDLASQQIERDSLLAILPNPNSVKMEWQDRRERLTEKEDDEEEEDYEEESFATWEELYMCHESKRVRKWKRRRGLAGRAVVSCLENLVTGYLGARRRSCSVPRNRSEEQLDLGPLVLRDEPLGAGDFSDAPTIRGPGPSGDQELFHPTPVELKPPPVTSLSPDQLNSGLDQGDPVK